jgi:serine/threonine protein kinase
MSAHEHIEKLTKSKYKVESEICTSLQGCILRGVCRDTKVQCVLKVVEKKLAETKQSKQGFSCLEDYRREFQVMKSVPSHNNVIRLLDCFEDEHTMVIVMEYGRNGDLFELLSQYATTSSLLNEEFIREVFRGVLSGITHLHEAGVCHLDVSLENIVLDEDWTPKLCDFGLARFVKPSEVCKGTRPGKQKYMALEILQGHRYNGLKADLYSLGVVLYCLCYGFHPYSSIVGDPDFDLIQSGHIKTLINSLPESCSRSSELKDLICKLIIPIERRVSLDDVWEHPWLSL